MPKKSRKSKIRYKKYKKAISPKHLTASEAGQPPQPVTVLPKQTTARRPGMTMEEQVQRGEHTKTEIKRVLITAGIVLVPLIIACILVR